VTHLNISWVQDSSALNELGEVVDLMSKPIAAISELCHPIWGTLALLQAQLDLQNTMRELVDLSALPWVC
jgi:hypothetical protein